MLLVVREAGKGTTFGTSKAIKVAILSFGALALAYAQNVPLNEVQVIVENQWYQLDVIEHLFSAILLFVAIKEAGK
jgi:hypothetical protein